MKRLATLALLTLSTVAFSQTYKNPKAAVEDRVKDLLSKMTLEEKIDYIGGYNSFYIRGIARFGLPEIKMADGPVGIRNYGKSTAYPASILTAATWDTHLAERLGEALGKDARQRGAHILLAPGVNIYRAPMNGRNFEYFGEDPYLAGRMAVNYINGVQSQKVVATVKHFAGNNQEWDRNHVSSDIDEQSLREIYLPAFKMAVQDGHVGAVMNSYNLVNGVHATQNAHLNNDILKNEWGFDGVLMSDWVSTYDGVAAANNGLDLEMPSGKFMNRAVLLPAIKSGQVKEEVINDKVRRLLRMIFRFGFYDTPYIEDQNRKEIPENAKVALELAQSGIVLLKNDRNTLPFSSDIKTIAVIGPNADHCIAGGGSSQTEPYRSVSLLEGLKKIAPNVHIVYGADAMPKKMEAFVENSPFYVEPKSPIKGLKAEYFDNQDLKGSPVAVLVDTRPDHDWKGAPEAPNVPADHFSMRFTGVVRPEKPGTYKFAVRGDDGFRLYVDDQLVIDFWNDHGSTLKTAELELKTGQEYKVRLEFYENGGGARIAFAVYQEVLDFSESQRAASTADAVILALGFDSDTEGEGLDRTFELPDYQNVLLQAVASVNPKTVLVLNSGGNVFLEPWLPRIPALVEAWYPGQDGGTALAQILFGKVNPSGKLPASYEKQWADNPTFANYYDPDNDKHVAYNEKLLLGYRYYDKAKVKPMFPFGFGLSYTTFAYSDLKVSGNIKDGFEVRFKLTNTGNYDGAEVAQVYVGLGEGRTSPERPVKELKGFTKVFLKKGESQTVSLMLHRDAFEHWKQNAFGYDRGIYEIQVGASSADMKLKATVKVD